MNKHQWMALGLTACMALALVGCGNDADKEPTIPSSGVTTVYEDKDYGFQLEKPAAGETIAVMHTSMGDVSIRFFPEAAPKAVENFITHAKDGYYDGLTFYRVIKGFMIQGGDPEGTGRGGKSIWGSNFQDEFDQKLLNLRGALSMANSGVNTNGSQFFINQATAAGDTAAQLKANYDYDSMRRTYENSYEQYKKNYGDSFTQMYPTLDKFIEGCGGISPDSRMVPDEVWELYAKNGGNIHLDGAWRETGGHTVFGQVYDGMDVVDAIVSVEVDSEGYKPLKDVTITSIEIKEYTAE